MRMQASINYIYTVEFYSLTIAAVWVKWLWLAKWARDFLHVLCLHVCVRIKCAMDQFESTTLYAWLPQIAFIRNLVYHHHLIMLITIQPWALIRKMTFILNEKFDYIVSFSVSFCRIKHQTRTSTEHLIDPIV